jgi:hypothetical protein
MHCVIIDLVLALVLLCRFSWGFGEISVACWSKNSIVGGVRSASPNNEKNPRLAYRLGHVLSACFKKNCGLGFVWVPASKVRYCSMSRDRYQLTTSGTARADSNCECPWDKLWLLEVSEFQSWVRQCEIGRDLISIISQSCTPAVSVLVTF